MNRVYIKTYGCQMNERDSEQVAVDLRNRGYSIVPHEDEADIVLLNTCSVRDQAEQKAIGKAGGRADQDISRASTAIWQRESVEQSRRLALRPEGTADAVIVDCCVAELHHPPPYRRGDACRPNPWKCRRKGRRSQA